MSRYFLAGLSFAVALSPVSAVQVMAPAMRAVKNPIVVIGKITAIEADPVEAEPFPGAKSKVPFKIALLKVESALSGAAGETHLKIGFQEGLTGGLGYTPKVGAEGAFFLTPHPSGGFVVVPPTTPPLEVSHEKYKEELAQVKKALAVIEKPADALAAKGQADRYFAAAILLCKYGTAPANAAKVDREPVSAGETKKLIGALLEADWAKTPPVGLPAPATLMWQLQLGPDDGWAPEPFKGPGEVTAHFKAQLKKWYAANGEKFRVKKYVEKK